MDLKEIQELINLLNDTNVTEISIGQGDFSITIKTSNQTTVGQQLPPPAVIPVATASVTTPVVVPEKQIITADDDSKLITIKSPMIGTFYRTPSPDKPSFVNVGDEIKQGDVLCIIEAMKLFNEIESEHNGRIVKILMDNAKPVEYDQPLFLIEPM
jgi:acetyl-CoA carboxylase biotin carboxyl carrier protein